jgi:ABC-type Fe3+-hydroxamate transport system substrate-binding protein
LDVSVADERVAFLALTERSFRLYGTLSPVNFIYEELCLTQATGIPTAPEPDNPSNFWKPVSLEVLPEIEAEHLFVSGESETVADTSL